MCCSVYGSNDVAGREALLLFFDVVNSFGIKVARITSRSYSTVYSSLKEALPRED